MFQILQNVTVDWLGRRRIFIGISVVLLLAGLGSAIFRQATGRPPFNLGVDFKGGTVVTVRFKQRPSDEAVREALNANGIHEVVELVADSSMLDRALRAFTRKLGAILDQKIDAIERAGVDAVVSGDASCLMQIGGRLSRNGSKVRTMHLAELLSHR